MKKLLHKILPSLGPAIHIIWGYLYDAKKFIKSSTSISYKKDKCKLSAILIRQYHGIEKALTLPNPRLGFGQDLVNHLVNNTNNYYKLFGYDELVGIVLDNLVAYIKFNSSFISDDFNRLKEKIDNLLECIIEYNQDNLFVIGGSYNLNKFDWLSKIYSFNFKEFSENRISVRSFSDEDVDLEILKEAIMIAQKSPSACNRQPWKVRVFKNNKKDYILQYQNGNRGFADSINTVLLITGLTSSFAHSERHSAWVDGGLFSMSLIYALHSLGLGVCALNTSYTVQGEKKLRKAVNLPLNEEPVMMLAIGHLKDNFTVANSPRKSLEEVLIYD